LQLPDALRAIPDRGTLGGVIQAPQRGCGVASAAEAPNRWPAEQPVNWQAIGAVGELLGGIVVLASLVFLGLQIRRNTQALRLGAAEDTNRSFAAYTAMFTQPGVSRLYRVGLASPQELDEDERITFNALISTLFNFISHAHSVRASGIGDVWTNVRGLNATANYVLRQPGGQLWWRQFRAAYNDEFQRYIDSLVEESAA